MGGVMLGLWFFCMPWGHHHLVHHRMKRLVECPGVVRKQVVPRVGHHHKLSSPRVSLDLFVGFATGVGVHPIVGAVHEGNGQIAERFEPMDQRGLGKGREMAQDPVHRGGPRERAPNVDLVRVVIQDQRTIGAQEPLEPDGPKKRYKK